MSKYEITIENYQDSVERHYFSILGLLKDFGFTVLKTNDTFDSSITSSFWGSVEQRRTLQQEKAAQFIAYIGNMVKQMFQIIRTIRIMDMKLKYYTQSKEGPDKAAGDIALKGTWIDMVEGGGKNPNSVTGLAMQVGFSTLPDVFFGTLVEKDEDIQKKIDELKKNNLGNPALYNVLKRKLLQFISWRDATEKEMIVGRKFHLAYLRQHFNIIRTYLHWVRPYLGNIKRLQQKGTRQEDVLEMADSAIADIELFAFKTGQKKYTPTMTVRIEYRTVPELAYQQEYQRGPIHVGRTHIIFEDKVMLADEIREQFRKDMLEDINLIEDLTGSMSAFGEELVDYLKKAKEADPEGKLGIKLEKEKVKPPKDFVDIFGKFKDIGKPLKNFSNNIKRLFGKGEPKEKPKADSKAPLVTYDLPGPVKDLYKEWEDYVKKKKQRDQKFYKKREDFEEEKDFKEYITALKKRDSFDEEKEKKEVRADLKDTTWKVYDTFKKVSGHIRW
jgi:hypothetical protein